MDDINFELYKMFRYDLENRFLSNNREILELLFIKSVESIPSEFRRAFLKRYNEAYKLINENRINQKKKESGYIIKEGELIENFKANEWKIEITNEGLQLMAISLNGGEYVGCIPELGFGHNIIEPFSEETKKKLDVFSKIAQSNIIDHYYEDKRNLLEENNDNYKFHTDEFKSIIHEAEITHSYEMFVMVPVSASLMLVLVRNNIYFCRLNDRSIFVVDNLKYDKKGLKLFFSTLKKHCGIENKLLFRNLLKEVVELYNYYEDNITSELADGDWKWINPYVSRKGANKYLQAMQQLTEMDEEMLQESIYSDLIEGFDRNFVEVGIKNKKADVEMYAVFAYYDDETDEYFDRENDFIPEFDRQIDSEELKKQVIAEHEISPKDLFDSACENNFTEVTVGIVKGGRMLKERIRMPKNILEYDLDSKDMKYMIDFYVNHTTLDKKIMNENTLKFLINSAKYISKSYL